MSRRTGVSGALAAASVVGVFVVGACSPDGTPLAAPAARVVPPSLSRSLEFAGLESSAVCTVAGGDPVNPLVLAPGYGQDLVASEPQFADHPDMNTVNETGAMAGRFLYRTHEVGGAASVSVTDLRTGETRTLASRADWERFDGIAWTPWSTIIAAEETGVAARRDPDFPDAIGGLVYELFVNRNDPSVVDSVVARPAIGSKSHEGLAFDASGNLYSASETNPGYIYKFVPDRRGDLSSGRSHALVITSPDGDRVGGAEWRELDRDAVRIDAVAAAAAAGATGYNRPEDLEMGSSIGNDRGGMQTLYIAITGPSAPADNRVLAIDLSEQRPGHGGAFVYEYVAWGVNVDHEFEMPDNLALDSQGNLYVTEDPGGSFRDGAGKTKGDDIWRAAPPEGGRHRPSPRVERFASLNDCDAEPTGIYAGKEPGRLFVNVQHRGGDGMDKAMVVSPRR